MKFFSLLSQREVHSAPGKKIIPSSEWSKAQEGAELLEEIKREEAEFRRSIAQEAEQIKEFSYQEGFQKGLESLNEHIRILDQAAKQIRDDVQKQIATLALSAARKIVGEELSLNPERIVNIVLNVLKPVTQHHRVTLYVNRLDLDLLEQNKAKLKSIFEHLDVFSIQERSDIEPGGCIIETEAGIINAQLENQWHALESAFRSFMKNKESP